MGSETIWGLNVKKSWMLVCDQFDHLLRVKENIEVHAAVEPKSVFEELSHSIRYTLMSLTQRTPEYERKVKRDIEKRIVVKGLMQ